MNRRSVMLGIGAAGAWVLAAGAQTVSKRQQVGFLFPGSATAAQARSAAVLDGLRTVGYDPDRVELVLRMSGGDPARIAELVTDLVGRKVDAIIAVSPAMVRAVRAATTTIPIIAHDLETDPVAAGLVESFAKPGGNVTGFFFDFPEFSKKWFELLREVSPAIVTLGVVWDPATGLSQRRAIEEVAGPLGVRLEIQEVASPAELKSRFETVAKHRPDALVILSSPVFGLNLERIAGLALRHRLVAITLFPEFARAGGLMAYGPDLLDTFREVGAMTGKVLRGAKPAELPIQRSTKFQLVVNLQTAKTLNVTVPQSILARADEVIE